MHYRFATVGTSPGRLCVERYIELVLRMHLTLKRLCNPAAAGAAHDVPQSTEERAWAAADVLVELDTMRRSARLLSHAQVGSRVPVQMWAGVSPGCSGADVKRLSPVPAQMWHG